MPARLGVGDEYDIVKDAPTIAMVELSNLSEEIHTALAEHGFAARRALLLSPLGEQKGRRCAYRVDDAGGQILKVRLFENPEEASRVYRLRGGLEEAFAPALACHGPVLIEEWIEGEPLTTRDWESWVEPAGALLGRLHMHPLAADEPSAISTRKWRDGALSDLDVLTAAGKLDLADADLLRREVLQDDPSVSRAALIHTDFCADNMLIDSRGRLRVIDNEGIAVRPPGFDLGRTFQLWPMPDASRKRFRRGYLSSGAPEPEASGFWRIVAVLMNARIFLKLSPERFEASLVVLRRLAAGEHRVDE